MKPSLVRAHAHMRAAQEALEDAVLLLEQNRRVGAALRAREAACRCARAHLEALGFEAGEDESALLALYTARVVAPGTVSRACGIALASALRGGREEQALGAEPLYPARVRALVDLVSQMCTESEIVLSPQFDGLA